eukprot:gene9946-12196_t
MTLLNSMTTLGSIKSSNFSKSQIHQSTNNGGWNNLQGNNSSTGLIYIWCTGCPICGNRFPHCLVPNPRYSPFLNAIEYLFNQLKQDVQPRNLLNYHNIVSTYLLKCLQKEPIHVWRAKANTELNLMAKENENEKIKDYKYEIYHRVVYSTEIINFDKPLMKGGESNPVKPSKQVMIIHGKKVPLFDKDNETTTTADHTTKQECSTESQSTTKVPVLLQPPTTKKRGRPPKQPQTQN